MMLIALVAVLVIFTGCGEGAQEAGSILVEASIEESSDRLLGWVGADDGILVEGRNRDGQIQQDEFFGNKAMTGRDVANSFNDLARLDYDNNGEVNDFTSPDLRVWKDKDGDCIVDAGELLNLSQAGVDYVRTSNRDVSDEVFQQRGTFRSTVGNDGDVACAWFRSEQENAPTWAILILDLNGNGPNIKEYDPERELFDLQPGTGFPVRKLS